jgi:four helix bundle protein
VQDFKQLVVWQKAHELTLAVYTETKSFPDGERFGLTNQMRRAVASIPANIAEGCGRDGSSELARFVSIAMGSASELEYQLLLCRDLNMLNEATYTCLNTNLIEIKKMLNVLIRKLKSNPNNQ